MRYFITDNWKYYIIRPHKFIIDCFMEFKSFIQRGKRGYADCDVWNFDNYLRDVLIGGLKHLADNTISYPGIKPFETPNKWKKYLIKTSRTLQDVNEYENEGFLDDKDYKKLIKVYKAEKKALIELAENFNHLWN